MKCRMVVLALSVLACLTSSFADSFAQDSTAPQSAPAPPKVKVYLAGFSEGTEHAFEGPADLKNFVNTYLYLRFSQINNASLTSELPDASCGPEQSSVRRSIQPQALAPHVPDSLSFYTIRGSLETHPHDPLAGADDVVINYELLKTVRCTP